MLITFLRLKFYRIHQRHFMADVITSELKNFDVTTKKINIKTYLILVCLPLFKCFCFYNKNLKSVQIKMLKSHSFLNLNKKGSCKQGRWKMGLKPPLYKLKPNFQPPHRNFQLPFSPSFQKFIITVHTIALQRWLMASLVIRFFSSLMPSNPRRPTNFCNFVTKVNKIAKTVGFPGTFVHKAFRALL